MIMLIGQQKKTLIGISMIPYFLILQENPKSTRTTSSTKNGLNKWDEDTEEHSGKENKVSRK